jgi:hypothetical protein
MTPAWALVILAFILTAPFWLPIVLVVFVTGALGVSLAWLAALEAIDQCRERARIRRLNKR